MKMNLQLFGGSGSSSGLSGSGNGRSGASQASGRGGSPSGGSSSSSATKAQNDAVRRLSQSEKQNEIKNTTASGGSNKVYTAVQNASNNNDSIVEVSRSGKKSEITASTRSNRMLVNDEWMSRGDTVDYINDKLKKGSRFFYRNK